MPGQIIDGSETLAGMGRQIFEKIIKVSNGAKTRSEILQHHEFAIHSIGPAI